MVSQKVKWGVSIAVGMSLVSLASIDAVGYAYSQGLHKGNWATANTDYNLSDKKAYASWAGPDGFMGSGGGVAAQAQCSRGDGRMQWYTSTNFRYAAGIFSTFDCDNNGTYNRALTSNDYFTRQ